MKIHSKINFLVVLAAVAFAQIANAQDRSIDDILGSAYVEHKPQPVDTTPRPTGPTPVKLDSISSAAPADTAAIKDSISKDTTATKDTAAAKAPDTVNVSAVAPDSIKNLDSLYTDDSDSTAADTTAADSAGSSSSGGLVLYEGNSSKENELKERYRRGELVYKYQATVGLHSPSRGIVSLEYIVVPEMLNVGIHFTDYNSDFFQVGGAIQFFPMEMRYFYMFLGSDWIHGEYERERDIGKKVFEEYEETVNYWRVVVGIGGEALFLEHFGMYLEFGFEFFAGDGGYYLHLNKTHGHLTNDTFKLPYGIGLLFPF